MQIPMLGGFRAYRHYNYLIINKYEISHMLLLLLPLLLGLEFNEKGPA